VVALMACCKIGAIAVPMSCEFGTQDVAQRLVDSEAKILICADGYARRGTVVATKETADEAVSVSDVEHVVVVRRIGREVPMTTDVDLRWDELLDGGPRETRTEPTTAEDPFLIAYSSNVTGRPIGSVHVHGGFLVKVAGEMAYQTDLRPGEVLFWPADSASIRSTWEIAGTLALGGTVFIYDGALDHPGPHRVWEMAARHRINVLGLEPDLVGALMSGNSDPAAHHDLSSLRILGATSEPWRVEPYMWFFDRVGGGRCPIVSLFGGTAVGGCLLAASPVLPLKPCSFGGPALGMAVDVYGQDGKPIRGDIGELVCTKPWPSLSRGIWGDPDRYIQTYWSRRPDIWTHEDMASVDADGQWFLHERRSDDTMNVLKEIAGAV
jgi:acetyl-CoA synthetase